MPTSHLSTAIRDSLVAKRARLLARPIVVRVDVPPPEEHLNHGGTFDFFRAIDQAAHDRGLIAARDPWQDDPSGSCRVRVDLDYDDRWRGREKEIIDALASTQEGGGLVFLTDVQRTLLECSPEEFLALRPEQAELVSFRTEDVGGSRRVTELELAKGPESRREIRHLGVLPNLVQLERQLHALDVLERATDDSPLVPLQALLGAATLSGPATPSAAPSLATSTNEHLDEHQRECVEKALATPHFAVIHGPPGSGKTTVICEILRRTLARGESALVVSPTHAAVDNVVEKLTKLEAPDLMPRHSLPVRFSSRPGRLSSRAHEYWVSNRAGRRTATLAARVQQGLMREVPVASALFARMDNARPGVGPVTAALAKHEAVVCGTPIGILGFESVKQAAPGQYGVLIVDEVSKMTLPEFLAVAVKARRWVLVGDPEQLPPYNDVEANAWTLDAVLDPLAELACSVGALLDRAKPADQRHLRLVVVSSEPERACAAIQAHVRDVVDPRDTPPIQVLGPSTKPGIVVCSPAELEPACSLVEPLHGRDRSHSSGGGSVQILCQRGLNVPRPAVGSGHRFVEANHRAQSMLFATSFNIYHVFPWTRRSWHKLPVLGFRNGLKKYLPSKALLDVLDPHGAAADRRRELVEAVALRLLANMVSVYDLLNDVPSFDVSPLQELAVRAKSPLRDAARPFVGALRKQYRMHSSLSRVPRDLFYFGDALHDGRPDETSGCLVRLFQVVGGGRGAEVNEAEAETILQLLQQTLTARGPARPNGSEGRVMIITPYGKQEEHLQRRAASVSTTLELEVCTLDRCQGREADYVFISLVKDRATLFMDMPKRWNVALTRARKGLFVVGNIDAYRDEARRARSGDKVSLLAHIIAAYDRQTQSTARASA